MKTLAGIAILAMFLTIIALGRFVASEYLDLANRKYKDPERGPLRTASYVLIALCVVFLVAVFLISTS